VNGEIVPAANANVVVKVKTGPDSGLTDVTVTTDEQGIAYLYVQLLYNCTGRGVGTDVFQTCLGTACSRTAQALWISDDVEIDLKPLDATLKVNEVHYLTSNCHSRP
jgi:hypothetical protein